MGRQTGTLCDNGGLGWAGLGCGGGLLSIFVFSFPFDVPSPCLWLALKTFGVKSGLRARWPSQQGKNVRSIMLEAIAPAPPLPPPPYPHPPPPTPLPVSPFLVAGFERGSGVSLFVLALEIETNGGGGGGDSFGACLICHSTTQASYRSFLLQKNGGEGRVPILLLGLTSVIWPLTKHAPLTSTARS